MNQILGNNLLKRARKVRNQYNDNKVFLSKFRFCKKKINFDIRNMPE